MIYKITAVGRAQRTSESHSGNKADPLRVYSGQSISFRIHGPHLANDDQISWIPSGERNCRVAGTSTFPALSLGDTVPDAVAGRSAVTTTAVTYVVAAENAAVFTGAMKLCHRSARAEATRESERFTAWRFYGTAHALEVVWVSALAVERAWVGQALPSVVQGVNLAAGDVVTWSLYSEPATATATTAAMCRAGNAGLGERARKLSSTAGDAAGSLKTDGDLVWSESTYTHAGPAAPSRPQARICWANGDVQGAEETFDTGRGVDVWPLDADGMFFFVFPSVVLAANGAATEFAAGTRLRIGGWFFQPGDRFLFQSDQGGAFRGETAVAASGIVAGSASPSGFASAVIDVGGEAFGDNPPSPGGAVQVQARFLPLSSVEISVTSPDDPHAQFYALHDDSRDRWVSGHANGEFKFPYLGAADFSGSAAAFLRGLEGSAYVRGLTADGDAVRFVAQGSACGGASAAVRGAADIQWSDGTWPEVRFTYETSYIDGAGLELCYRRASPVEVGVVDNGPGYSGAAVTSIALRSTSAAREIRAGDAVRVGAAAVCAVTAVTGSPASALTVAACDLNADPVADGDPVSVVYAHVAAGGSALEPRYQAYDNRQRVASGDQASAGTTNSAGSATLTTKAAIAALHDGDAFALDIAADSTVYTVVRVDSATTATISPPLAVSVAVDADIVRAFRVPGTVTGVRWFMYGFEGSVPFAWSDPRAGAPEDVPLAGAGAGAADTAEIMLTHADPADGDSSNWSACHTEGFAAAKATGSGRSRADASNGASAAVPYRGLVGASASPFANVDAAGTYSACYRHLHTAAPRATSSPWRTIHTLRQHPAITAFPTAFDRDAAAGATPAVGLSLRGVASGDSLVLTDEGADPANPGLCRSGAGEAAGKVVDASRGFVAIPRADLAGKASPGYCVVRAGDSRGYYFPPAAVGSGATVSGLPGTNAVAALPTAFYAGGSDSYTVATTDAISVATSSSSSSPSSSSSSSSSPVYISADPCDAAGTAASAAAAAGDAQIPVVTGGTAGSPGGAAVIASLTEASGSPTATARWCQGDNELVSPVTVAQVKGTCSHTGEYACTVGVAIVDVKHYGFFVPDGSGGSAGTGSKITFDVAHAAVGDAFGWVPSGSAAAATATLAPADITHKATTASGAFSGDALVPESVSGSAAQGGVHLLYYRPAGAPNFYRTGHSFPFVRFTARFPASAVRSDAVTVWFGGGAAAGDGEMSGFAAGDTVAFVKAGSGCGKVGSGAASWTPVADERTPAATLTEAQPGSLRAVFDLSSWTAGANTAAADLCFATAGMSGNTAAEYATFSLASGGGVDTALTVKGTSASADLPATDLTGTARINAGAGAAPATIALTSGTLQGSASTVKVVRTAAGAARLDAAGCDAAAAVAASEGSASIPVKSAARLDAFEFSVTASAGADEGGSTYQLCFAAQGSAPTSSGFAGALGPGPVVAVELRDVSPLWLVRNPAASHVQRLALTVNAGHSSDAVCLVPSGSPAPTAAACAHGASVAGAAYVSASASAPGGFEASFAQANVAALEPGLYDLYFNAGSHAYNTPRLLAGKPVLVVEPELTPATVLATTASDRRTMYARILEGSGGGASPTAGVAGGDRFFFAGGGTSCAGAANGAVVSGSDGTLVGAEVTPLTPRVCFLHRSDTRAVDNSNYVELDAAVTALDTFRLDGGGRARFHARVATPVTFSRDTDTVQPGDRLRVLASGKTCGVHTAAGSDVVAEATVSFASFDATPTATITVPETEAALPVCWAKKADLGSDVVFPRAGFSTAHAVFARSVSPRAIVARSALYAAADDAAGKNPRVTIAGHNVGAGDFASFVLAGEADCAKAWLYEQALTSSNTDVTVNVAAEQTGAADFVISAGAYQLCYHAVGTGVGYRAYPGLTLRATDAARIEPMFASAGVPSTFTLHPASPHVAAARFRAGDRVTFIRAGSPDCLEPNRDPGGGGSAAAGVHNVSASTSAFTHNFTGGSPPPPTTPDASPVTKRDFALCSDLEGSVQYSTDAAGTSFATSGMLDPAVTVTVFSGPAVGAVSPSSVVRGEPASLTVYGGFLSGSDTVSRNATVAGAPCAAVPGPESRGPVVDLSPGLNRARVEHGFEDREKGARQLCYWFARRAASQAVRVDVVDVDALSPTGSPPTPGNALGVDITFHGHFNAALDDDWAFLIPRRALGRDTADCSKFGNVEVTEAWIAANRRRLRHPASSSGARATGTFNVTSLPDADEYRACIRFGGTAASGLIARDWHLSAPNVVFSVRAIADYAPPAVVNNTANQVLTFRGSGIRDGDTVVAVAAGGSSSSAAAATEAECGAATITASVTLGRAVFHNLSPGAYHLCYRFNTTMTTASPSSSSGSSSSPSSSSSSTQSAWIPVLSSAGAPLRVEDYALSARISPTRAQDVRSSVVLRVRGVGVAAGDRARIVNATAVGTGGGGGGGAAAAEVCGSPDAPGAPSGAAGSSWQRVVLDADVASRDTVWWSIPAGEMSVSGGAGSFAICYAFAGGSGSRLSLYNGTAWKVEYLEGPVIQGNFPRRIVETGSSIISIVGYKLSAGDQLAVTQLSDCASAFGNRIGVANVTAAPAPADLQIATAPITTVSEGDHNVCYYFGGEANLFQHLRGAIRVGSCTPQCTSAKRFLCGCECRSEPCNAASNQPCGTTGFTYCAPSGVCARAPAMCPRAIEVCPSGELFRCPLGDCAITADDCAPIEACPTGARRCGDGSCSFGECVFANEPIEIPTCADGEELCIDGLCRKEGECVPFNGCPIGQAMCADCSCVVDRDRSCPSCARESPATPYMCFDGSCVATMDECPCHRYKKFPAVNMLLTSEATSRRRRRRLWQRRRTDAREHTRARAPRRFVVRGNTAYSFNLGLQIRISFPAGLTVEDGCTAKIEPLADSFIRAVETDTAKIIATPLGISILSGKGSGGCALDESKGIDVNFLVSEVPETDAALTCNFMGTDPSASVTATRAALKAACSLRGPILSGAHALATGPLATPIPAPVATPELPSATPVASAPITTPTAEPSPSSTEMPGPSPISVSTASRGPHVSHVTLLAAIVIACVV